MVTKSSLMLGLGETDDEVLQAMKGVKHLIYNSSNTYTFSVIVKTFLVKETLIDLFTPKYNTGSFVALAVLAKYCTVMYILRGARQQILGGGVS